MTDAELIAASVERLFADHVDRALRDRAEAGAFDHALWHQVSDLGLPLMLATEPAGGLGLPWVAAYPVLRAVGHAQVPLPLAETLIGAQLLSAAGLALPDLAEAPLALVEQSTAAALHAVNDGPAVRLSGVAHHVAFARHAQAAVVALTDGRVALLPLHADGVTQQPHVDAAGQPSDTLLLHGARCDAVAPSELSLAQPAWTLGAAARAMQMVGALEWVLAQTVTYAGERMQFGKPIGRNQAIQQNLALMAGDVAAARMAAQVAARDLPGPDGSGDAAAARFSTAVAKVRCGEAATRATSIAHQVHGAIGFTHEHALHFATRRLWAWRDEWGSDATWAAELGRAAIRARAAGFWPGVTARHFTSAR